MMDTELLEVLTSHMLARVPIGTADLPEQATASLLRITEFASPGSSNAITATVQRLD